MTRAADETRAERRFALMNLARLGGLGAVLLGIAITQALIPLPWVAGVALALAGLLEFFFGPPLLARRWKAQDHDHK